MTNISLSNYRLPYSICVQDIFWVKNGIINIPEIRQSRDEEAIAYIILNMILPENERKPLTYQVLNKFYGYSSNPLDTTMPIEMTQINNAIDRVGFEVIKKQFRIVMSCFEEMLNISGKNLRQIIHAPATKSDLINPFQIIFMALYKLLIKDKKTQVDYSLLLKKLDGNCGNIVNKIGKSNNSREYAIDSVYGLIQGAFKKGMSEDPSLDDWTLEFVNILNKSRTEQVLYDFKIGFVQLNEKKIEVSNIEKVLKTLTAINNLGPFRTGYVIIGVADKEEDAEKYKEKYGIDYTRVGEFLLCGIEHDAIACSQNIDRYTHTIKEYIHNSLMIPDGYKMHILSQMKTPMLYGKHAIVFKTCYTEPVAYNNNFYLREFTDVNKLAPEQMTAMLNNYYQNKVAMAGQL